MELRQYWHVLVRRRIALRNTFLLVAVIALALVAYSYSGALYQGHTMVNIQVAPAASTNKVVYDPQAAAQLDSDRAVNELTKYTAGTQYFRDVSTEVYGKPDKWKQLQASTKGIYQIPDSHEIYIEWDGSSTTTAAKVVKAELDQLKIYIPEFQRASGMPRITATVIDPPTAQRISLTKPLADVLLRLALGLIAGIIVAYLFEYLDDTVQDEADVQRWIGLPTLAVIPGGRQARRARSA